MPIIKVPGTNLSIKVEKPLFELKELVVAKHTLDCLGILNIAVAIRRHLTGYWGDITPTEVLTNRQAIKEGGNIVSVHRNGKGDRFIIITDTVEGSTTVLKS